jgi:hypothetical protein
LTRPVGKRAGATAVLAAGLLWSLLCGLLAAGEHAPSVTLLPIPRQSYYAFQAVVVVPLLFLLWRICATVADRTARALGGGAPAGASLGGIGLALGVPLCAAMIVPDLIVYGLYGFSALARLVRITAPVAAIVTLLWATLVIRGIHRLSAFRSLVAAFAGVVAQGVVGGIVLR